MGLVLGSHANPTAIDDIVSVPDDAGRVLIMNPSRLASDDAGIDLLPGGAQDFTDAWVDLGPEIAMHGYNSVNVGVSIDINLSTGVQFRWLEKFASAAVSEYPAQIETVLTAKTELRPDVIQVIDTTPAADSFVPFVHVVSSAIPYLQLQVRALVPSGTPGSILTAEYARGWV